MLYIIQYQFLLASKRKECLLKIYTQEIANLIAKKKIVPLFSYFFTQKLQLKFQNYLNLM